MICREPSVAFCCDLCSVNVTCQEQLDAHLNGARHKNKLKQKERVDSGQPPFENSRGRGRWRGRGGNRGRGNSHFAHFI